MPRPKHSTTNRRCHVGVTEVRVKSHGSHADFRLFDLQRGKRDCLRPGCSHKTSAAFCRSCWLELPQSRRSACRVDADRSAAYRACVRYFEIRDRLRHLARLQ